MKIKILILALVSLLWVSCQPKPETKTISREVLKDKIAGGWAGKMIGVTFGAPTEFRAQGKTFDDSIKWKASDVKGSIWQDDIYVQLTFLMTMDKYGMEAPAKTFQEMFAKAGYWLWHANVQARKNYFDSIFPPQSGQPEFNIHADDIDFQIEADYIGFMFPGMPASATKVAGKIGHIMNYGDGVYGGIFVGALYSEAFFESDIEKIIEKALQSIPPESDYSKTINDVVSYHKQYPENWRAAWDNLEKKWGSNHICGAKTPFNIDAKLNGAYIVMGLLYGDGDPVKTMEISVRCGQDSDCNPSNAMAVLGVIKGFSSFPFVIKKEINAMADSNFIYTNYNFTKAVESTFNYALENILKGGGKVNGDNITITCEKPVPPAFEVSFPNIVADTIIGIQQTNSWKFTGNWNKKMTREWHIQTMESNQKGDVAELTFQGTGIILNGNWTKNGGKADLFVDGKLFRTINTWYYHFGQEHENIQIGHVLNLKPGTHTLRIVVKGEKCEESSGTTVSLISATILKTDI